MLFSSVIGHDEIKKRLIQSVRDNRVSHAQLFLGAEGSGNLALAFAFAQYINCESRTENDLPACRQDSCGKCASCIKSQKLIHPDIHFSYPVITRKNLDKPKSVDYLSLWREAFLQNPYMNVTQWLQFIQEDKDEDKRNKQGNITVEECHDIIRKLNLKTFEAKYKVLLMWMPEYLGSAGNTLLKIIEEPPDNTVFLLVGENQDLILNTILSRTQLVRINQLRDEQIKNTLCEQHQVPAEEASRLAFMADGNYNEALSLLKENEDNNAREFQYWFTLCSQNKGNEIAAWVDKISKTGRENQKSFLRYGLQVMRESMVMGWVEKKHWRLQSGESGFVKTLQESTGFEQKEKIIELFNKNHYYIERNANPKILFMHLSVSISGILRNKDVILEIIN